MHALAKWGLKRLSSSSFHSQAAVLRFPFVEHCARLARTGRIRPIRASASEDVELRDCRRREKLAPWERISRISSFRRTALMLYPFAYRSRRLIILPVFSSLFRYRRKDDGDAKDEPGQAMPRKKW